MHLPAAFQIALKIGKFLAITLKRLKIYYLNDDTTEKLKNISGETQSYDLFK